MQSAAIVGQVLRLDPIAVLAERSPFNRSIRLAATSFIVDERKKLADQARAEAAKPPGR